MSYSEEPNDLQKADQALVEARDDLKFAESMLRLVHSEHGVNTTPACREIDRALLAVRQAIRDARSVDPDMMNEG